MQELGSSASALEHSVTWNELSPGKPLTRQGLKESLEHHRKVAMTCQEKLAGCIARMKSRSA